MSGAEVFERGIQADPSYAKNYLGRGNVCLMAGDEAGAREYFNRALQAQPGYGAARQALQRMEG